MDNISLNGKIWVKRAVNEQAALEVARSLNISDFLSQILLSRIETIDHAFDFLSPRLKNMLPNPFHLLDMQKAVDRTIKAIINKDKICIFADYDVDGATSAALLKNILHDLGQDADIYVPDRIAEGYGPTRHAMQRIKETGCTLVITVDCGAMAHDALKYAKESGLDVIVIDHHITSEILPDAVAVVNPNRIDEISNYGYLAAVGVSFLFATALIHDLKKLNFFAPNSRIAVPVLMQYLDLVALGTVCDVMKLVHLNRAFVHQGLKIIQQRQNLGMRVLSDLAGISEKPNCYHLGFVIGPRINAGGRVGKSSLGATLLSTKNEEHASQLAQELELHNNERKVIELAMVEEAMNIALSQEDDSSLFIVGKGWHPGVIGIVAGRLKEKFNKPVSVIALNEGIGKASCRSIKNIDFGSKIFNAKEKGLIIVGGGHAMAAGFTVMEEKLQELQIYLNKSFAADLIKTPVANREEYDLDLTTSSVNNELMEELSKLEPFGQGNHEPLFKFNNLFVLKASIVGEKHIRCLLAPSRDSYGSKAIPAIAFNAVTSSLEDVLLSPKGTKISIIGSLKMNSWKDRHTIQIQIKDIISSPKLE